MNYFELLGLAPCFALDPQALEQAYFQAQRQFHPDRFVGKSAPERAVAMQHSADINQAYETLKKPLQRAQYLLRLQDIAVGTEQDSIKPPAALLMEVMELREQPVEKDILNAMITDSIGLISGHYAAPDWPAMAQETLRLGYLMKIHNEQPNRHQGGQA